MKSIDSCKRVTQKRTKYRNFYSQYFILKQFKMHNQIPKNKVLYRRFKRKFKKRYKKRYRNRYKRRFKRRFKRRLKKMYRKRHKNHNNKN